MTRFLQGLRMAYTAFRMGWLGWQFDGWSLMWPGKQLNKYHLCEFTKDDQTVKAGITPQEAVGFHVCSGGVTYAKAYKTPWEAAKKAHNHKCQTR